MHPARSIGRAESRSAETNCCAVTSTRRPMYCSPAWRSGRRSKRGASDSRSEAGYAKQRLQSLESLPSFCTGCGSTAPNSAGHQRRLPINLHSRTTELLPTSGTRRPCRDAGVGAIVPGFAMLRRAKRASHIDPPASSHAIMRRACPYRGENPGPGKDVHGELDPWPGIREQPGSRIAGFQRAGLSPLSPKAAIPQRVRNRLSLANKETFL
jgi:hypothetical protein